jgi:hypothetical protein
MADTSSLQQTTYQPFSSRVCKHSMHGRPAAWQPLAALLCHCMLFKMKREVETASLTLRLPRKGLWFVTFAAAAGPLGSLCTYFFRKYSVPRIPGCGEFVLLELGNGNSGCIVAATIALPILVLTPCGLEFIRHVHHHPWLTKGRNVREKADGFDCLRAHADRTLQNDVHVGDTYTAESAAIVTWRRHTRCGKCRFGARSPIKGSHQ